MKTQGVCQKTAASQDNNDPNFCSESRLFEDFPTLIRIPIPTQIFIQTQLENVLHPNLRYLIIRKGPRYPHVNLDTPTTLGLVANIDDAAVQDDPPDASIAPTDASVAPTGGHGATIADDNDNAPFEVLHTLTFHST